MKPDPPIRLPKPYLSWAGHKCESYLCYTNTSICSNLHPHPLIHLFSISNSTLPTTRLAVTTNWWRVTNAVLLKLLLSSLPLVRKDHYQRWYRSLRMALLIVLSSCSLQIGTYNVFNRLWHYSFRYHFRRRYGTFKFYSIRIVAACFANHLNWVRRGYCLCYCRSSCRSWSFLENSGEISKERLVHQYFSYPNHSDRRSWSTYPWWTKSHTARALSQLLLSSYRNIYISYGWT